MASYSFPVIYLYENFLHTEFCVGLPIRTACIILPFRECVLHLIVDRVEVSEGKRQNWGGRSDDELFFLIFIVFVLLCKYNNFLLPCVLRMTWHVVPRQWHYATLCVPDFSSTLRQSLTLQSNSTINFSPFLFIFFLHWFSCLDAASASTLYERLWSVHLTHRSCMFIHIYLNILVYVICKGSI